MKEGSKARQVFDQTCGRGHTARRSRKKGSSRLRDCLEIIQTSIWRSALSQGVSVSSITCDTQHNDVGQTHACGHAFTCARASIHNAMMWGRPMHVVMCFGNKVRRTGINGSAEVIPEGDVTKIGPRNVLGPWPRSRFRPRRPGLGPSDRGRTLL